MFLVEKRMENEMKIVAATKNKGKIREFNQILVPLGFEVVSMGDMGIETDVDENGETFMENAVKKATEIMKVCGEITLADDSGLCVDALDGAPGVYSARYSGEDCDDKRNNLKLLKEMEGIKNRNAHFTCAIAVAFPDGRIKTAEGEFYGQIDYEMKGTGGFGYDVLFYLPEYKMTSAEIPADVKNKISHRYKALKKIAEKLKEV